MSGGLFLVCINQNTDKNLKDDHKQGQDIAVVFFSTQRTNNNVGTVEMTLLCPSENN